MAEQKILEVGGLRIVTPLDGESDLNNVAMVSGTAVLGLTDTARVRAFLKTASHLSVSPTATMEDGDVEEFGGSYIVSQETLDETLAHWKVEATKAGDSEPTVEEIVEHIKGQIRSRLLHDLMGSLAFGLSKTDAVWNTSPRPDGGFQYALSFQVALPPGGKAVMQKAFDEENERASTANDAEAMIRKMLAEAGIDPERLVVVDATQADEGVQLEGKAE